MPLDQAVLGIVPDQDHDRGADAQRGLDFLRIHHEPGVAGDRQRGLPRKRELGGNRARHADTHGRKAIRDNAGIRTLRLEHARHPHLVRADVGDDDILGIERLAQIENDALRH